MNERIEELKSIYHLMQHPEGGWFAENYTAPFSAEGRSYMGNIFFLLNEKEISHFHQIDCDEIWYYHEGCGLKITVLNPETGECRKALLGKDLNKGQSFMAFIPAGAIFASENLDKEGYCFVSCATTPKFSYEGFRLIYKQELKESFPDTYESISYLSLW